MAIPILHLAFSLRASVVGATTRVQKSLRRALVPIVTLSLAPMVLIVSGCGDLARLVTPGVRGPQGPAMIAFTANVPRTVATAADLVTLNVTASYVRQDGTRVRIGSQLLSLTTETLQSVPIPVDVATCIADVARDTGGTTGTSSCAVVLNLALQVNGTVVDEQVIGPLRLSPGTTATVTQPVTLIDLASVELLQGGGATIGATETVQAFLGAPTSFAAKVRDTRGQLVTDRAVMWSTDDPAVATIDATAGVLTTVAIGTTKVTARIGALSASAAVRVLRAPAALTISVGTGSGLGKVTSSPAGIDCRVVGATLTGSCSFIFSGDAAIALTSTADAGSVFATWGDACVAASIGTVCQVVMSQARVASASFTALRRVSVSAAGGSDGRGRVTSSAGLDCRLSGSGATGSCAIDVPQGTSVQLTAVGEPQNGGAATVQFFAGWGGDCAASTGASCTITSGNANSAVTARFVDAQTLSVAIDGVGGGSVTAAGIACTRAGGATTGSCSTAALFGSTVTLTAQPDAQSSFSGWTGACSGQALTCTTTLSQARAVTALFSRRQVQLVLTLSGAGVGALQVIGGSPCSLVAGQGSNSCTQTFDVGTTVTLTWSAGATSSFTGFGGACSGLTTCTLVLSQSQGVSASFGARQVSLTLTAVGAGIGTISASNGLSCTSTSTSPSATCVAQVELGAQISVTATPGDLSSFDSFGGDCSGRVACTVTMNSSKSVSATFTKKRVQFTVSLSGTGGGVVASNGTPLCALPLGQGLGSCAAQVDVGAVITLAASPGIESNFAGFSGAGCNSNPCTVTVSNETTINASFQRKQFVLQMGVSGTGAGTLAVDGFLCSLALGQGSNTCTRLVDYGTTITPIVAPAAGSSFENFGGACTGSGTCSFVMTAPASISALLTRRQAALTLTLTGAGGGTFSAGAAGSCSLAVDQGAATCVRLVDIGTTISINASAADGSVFQGFGGSCISNSASTFANCTLLMDGSKSVSGTFAKRMAPIVASPAGDATVSATKRRGS